MTIKVIGAFTTLRDAIDKTKRELIRVKSIASNCSAVFDIDDTVIQDDGSTGLPNVQAIAFLKWCKSQNIKVHLVTARLSTPEIAAETRDDLQRQNIVIGRDYDTLELCPNAWRASLARVSQWKHKQRLRHCSSMSTLVLTVGDQWGDLVPIPYEDRIDELDVKFRVNETPWLLVSPGEFPGAVFGLKLMAP